METKSEINRDIYDHSDPEKLKFKAIAGISEELVRQISKDKNEPEWMLQKRLEALKLFNEMPMPNFGPSLSDLNLNEISYFIKPDAKKNAKTWDDVPEDIKKTYENLGIPKAEREALAGVGAQYECLSGDSKVFTSKSGLKEIKDIKPRDKVFSFDEFTGEIKPALVKGVKFRGNKEVFEVKVGTRKIKVTAEHPFLALINNKKKNAGRGRYKKEWKYLSDLRIGDLIAIAKQIPHEGESYKLPEITNISHKHNFVGVPDYTNEDIMWFLGLYLGDGFIHREKNKARIEIAIPKEDSQLRMELVRVIESLFKIKASKRDKDRIAVYSTLLAGFVEKIGFGGKAYTKSIPNWLFLLPKGQILAFLGGYLDSDGYVRNDRKSHDLVFTSVNKNLLKKVRILSQICGLSASEIHEFKSKHVYDKTRIITSYRLQLSGNTDIILSRSEKRFSRFGKEKYYHKFNSAKDTSFKKHINYFIGFAKIESIKLIGIEPVYDIEVENYHNFIAEGIIVHNSEVIYHKLKKQWEDKGVVFLDADEGLQQYPELFKKYFMTNCIPANLHKFTALHGAFWSGGTFIYVPKGVKVDLPLQAYFRMNARKGGQFEHTLIIADEGSEIHYIEGCFTKGNLITCNPDYKKIEDIRKNDLVLTSEGRFKKVTNIQVMPYSGDLYIIEFYGDSTQKIEVTSDHPFLYVDRKNKTDKNKIFKPKWNIPRFFKKGDYLAMPINKIEKSEDYREFEVEYKGKKEKIKAPMTQEFFRLVGYYLAEGSIIGEHYLCFDFNSKERKYIDDVKKLLESIFSAKPYEQIHKVNNGTSVRVNSAKLARLFKQFGNRSYNKQIPDWAMYEKEENQAELINGWFRGDGNYYNKKHKSGYKEIFRINTTSKKLSRQGRDLLLRNGVVSFINARDRSKENRKTIYTLGIAGEQMIKFSEIVGIKIKSKLNNKNRASMFGIDEKFAYLPIKKITKKEVENVPVFNFSVEDDETYTVSGITVHNCSAPVYSENSLHAGGVEIHVLKNARVRYSSIENWSKNVYNLNTKRAIVHENGIMEWVNGNTGSKITMLYPSSVLIGENAKTDYTGIAYANSGQYQDTGCKAYHMAPNTSSHIISKSICMKGGTTAYRGLVKIKNGCVGSKSSVRCDGLMLDNKSKATTFPSMEVDENDVEVSHEAAVGKIGEEQLFYLMSRGLSEKEATKMIVSGFIEPLIRELPLEYAVELNRLIELEIENSVV